MDKVRIGDVCTVVSGSTPKSNIEEYWNGDIKWITPAEIDGDSYVISDTERHITEKAVEKTNLTLLPVGTVLLSSRAPIGKTAIAGAEMYCNQGFKNLICSEKIYNRYLYFFLTSKVDYLNALGRGATFKEISKGIVEDVEIPLPTIEVQKNIAKRLEVIQQLINNRKQALLQIDNLVKSRFVEMFGDLRINPCGWKIQSFADLTDLITDGEHATPRRVQKGIYLLSARNVLNHSIQLDDVDYIDEEEYKRIAKRVVPKEGDVLISCSGSVGRCCSVPVGLKFQMVRSAALLRFKSFINPVFAEYMITSDYLQGQINSAKTASSQANLFQGRIAKLKGFAPPIDLQKKFADFVAQADKSKLSIQQSIETLQTLKAKLMQDYFG